MSRLNAIRSINPEQVASLLRIVLNVIGTSVATTGYLSGEQWTAISGAILTLAVTLWGLWARSDDNLIKSAAAVPAVQTIVAPGSEAAKDDDKYPNVKVV